ncbi:MAG TPA: asparagine synthase (glutamine-hydrolyzing) [Terriglobales bacterium]|jgi:asparagine synthase (glutamine-hydrolysing)|nr:asparagine synthase (glutamine-hydrolyzing) [Terriglobales bacterium]
MCGISGLANCGDRETLTRMTNVQTHRGPDDSGLWERRFPDGGYIGLGSRRLAILDLSAEGHMPMSNEDGSVWITYNGEIYNFAELRSELEAKGHSFRSHADTEVIVHLYEEYGPDRFQDCLNRLNGMFALAICDLRAASPKLFLARDHFGIKPFYYWERGGKLAFASEIKALLEVPGIEASMNLEALDQYLTFLWVPDPLTMFEGIRKLPAGHYALWQDGRLDIKQYWDLTFPPADYSFTRTEADLAEEIRERFCASVEQQMVSDVPIGAFLSAGLDSSSIVAAMARKQSVRTYTITFPKKYRVGEATIDDPGVPQRLARRLGCDHHEIVVEPDVVGLLPNLTWHMDEPTADPAIITAYLVCREARKNATVLLSGVGGDEIFAGYRKHVAQAWAEKYKRVPGFVRLAGERILLGLPSLRGTRMKGSVRLAKKMARSAGLSPAQAFIRNCTYLDADQKTDLYAPQTRWATNGNSGSQHQAAFDQVRHADFLNQMLYLDTKIFMPTLNLTYNDKMSMASSVEVRVPFLDRGLAEFVAWNVKPEWKLKGRWRPVTKHIFREAMRSMLPEEVMRQPKAGFAAPVDYWLAHELRPLVDDLLSETQVRKRGLLRPEVVRRYVDEQRRGAEDWSMQIWQLLTLEIWMQLFIDGGARSFAQRQIGAQQLTVA